MDLLAVVSSDLDVTHTHSNTQAHVCVYGCFKVSWLIKALRCRTEDVTCAAQ
jgi:hypothetical protein